MLRLPSPVVGRIFSLLLNVAQPFASHCRVLSVARYRFDDRLLVAPPLQED